VSCAEIADGLADSALFGHRRGAFTGACEDALGLFGQADRGTLFLDELGEATPPLQAKLLRAVESGEVRPVGGRSRKVDARIVAATSADLPARVARGMFRADLYHRLAAIRIDVPPLRERMDDVLPLARRFLAELAGDRPPRLSRGVVEALLRHAWPGNVRELRNAVARGLALGSDPIGARHLALETAPSRAPRGLGELVDRAVQDALSAEDGNVRRAARRLGIHRSTLHRRLKRREAER
jgi:DNA-binding NtrC family response regulator